MPQDGTIISNIVQELSQQILGGRVDKITQPEPDEIVLNIRSKGENHKLLLTTQATAPRIHFTDQQKPSPKQAPMFCMVLRKHISSGRIVNIKQPDFERIVELHIDALDEMGDRSIKILVIELMGKHSNIMLLGNNTETRSNTQVNRVIDAIKHIPPSLSSVRPIMPGGQYSRPPSDKANPLLADKQSFYQAIFGSRNDSTASLEDSTANFNADSNFTHDNPPVNKALYLRYMGLSPVLASEICHLATILQGTAGLDESGIGQSQIYMAFTQVFDAIKEGHFAPHIYFDDTSKAVDITALPFSMYSHLRPQAYTSPSAMLEDFYAKRDAGYRVAQKTADLRKLIAIHHERCQKKTYMFQKTLNDIKDRDKLRIKGEILTAYLHQVEKGTESVTLENFYDDNNPIKINLSPTLTPTENAQRYFKQYNKQKRTHTALEAQILQNQQDQDYLESVTQAMETVATEADIAEIRAELAEQGFVKRKHSPGKSKPQKQEKSKPLRFVSSDGFEIFVGKNNTQNDYLTMRLARNSDIWLHTKDIAGSHVIIMTSGVVPPESTILEAANLAAYYSKGRNSSQVPIDYVERRHVRKPNGAKPGYVIYDRHKTVYISPKEPNAASL